MSEEKKIRPILWVSSSKRDLMDMPEDVIDNFGFGLYQAQIGNYPDIGKTLSGFGSANVVELKTDHKGSVLDKNSLLCPATASPNSTSFSAIAPAAMPFVGRCDSILPRSPLEANFCPVQSHKGDTFRAVYTI